MRPTVKSMPAMLQSRHHAKHPRFAIAIYRGLQRATERPQRNADARQSEECEPKRTRVWTSAPVDDLEFEDKPLPHGGMGAIQGVASAHTDCATGDEGGQPVNDISRGDTDGDPDR